MMVKLKFLMIIFLMFSICSCQNKKADKTYRVSLRHIPTKLDVRNNQVNSDVYIITHLYWPLFTIEDDGRLNSHFLDMNKTRALSERFDTFNLCLKANVKFSDGSSILPIDLLESIKETHHIQEILNSIKSARIVNNCVEIILTGKDVSYFRKLTGNASTILKDKEKKAAFPIGKGPYKIQDHSDDKLSLIADDAYKGFEKIEFLKYKTIEDNINQRIDDWNHTYRINIPEEIKKKSKIVKYSTLKTYAVIFNYPDKRIRDEFVRCFNAEEFKKDIGILLKETKGFLPNGVMGNNITYNKRKSQNCKSNRHKKESIIFYNISEEYAKDLPAYFNKVSESLPINIITKNVNIDTLIKVAFNKEKYLAIVGFDSSGSLSSISEESSVFFESFIRENRIIDKVIPELKVVVDQAILETNRDKKNYLYTQAHKILLDSSYVIPLGQNIGYQYYPLGIQNIKWADRISGVPQVNMMVLKDDK